MRERAIAVPLAAVRVARWTNVTERTILAPLTPRLDFVDPWAGPAGCFPSSDSGLFRMSPEINESFRRSMPGLPDVVARGPFGIVRLFLWARCLVRLCLTVGFLGIAADAAGIPVETDRPVPEVWQVPEGLPHNEVTSVAQTPDGYLWVGTRGGLARFDGIRFEVFRGNTPGLEDRSIDKLFVDSEGGLWIATASGHLACFTKGRFQPMGGEQGWSGRRVVAFALDLAHRLWLMDSTGRAWVYKEGRFEVAGGRAAEPNPGLHSWVLDKSCGRWALDAGRRLQRWRGGKWEVVADPAGGFSGRIQWVAPARSGGLWVADEGFIRRIDGDRWTADLAGNPVNAESPTAVSGDSEGHLWLGTSGSALFRIPVDQSPAGALPLEGIPTGTINDVFEDREGNIWVASDGGGLIALRPGVFRSFGMAEGLPSEPITALAEETPGRLVVGTLGGGMYFFEAGRFFGPVSMLGRSVSVESLLARREGGIWAGTRAEGLLLLNGMKSARFSTREGLASPSVLSLFEDRAGVLWVGHPSGLSRYDGTRFTQFTAADGLPDSPVRAIAQDSQGDLWIGTADGLARLQKGKFTRWTSRDGLAGNQIQTLLPGSNGEIWIGSVDGGLSRFKDGNFFNYLARNGLPDESITTLLEDDSGRLWVGTGHGVFRVAVSELEEVADGTKARLEGVTYETRDGLASIQLAVGQPAGLRSSDGSLWFATPHALNRVFPGRLSRNSVPPPVAIEQVTINGERVYSNADVTGRVTEDAPPSILVPAGRRHVEISYTALSFNSPTQTRFRIQLEGAEAVDHDVGSRRIAFYDGLPPGSYRFRVSAANSDGVRSLTSATLEFGVKAFLWETWWFNGGTGIGLLGLAGVYLRRRIARRERERVAETLRLQAVALGSAGDGIVITDPRGGVVWTNPAFTRLTGYESGEVVGRSIRLLKSGEQTPGFYQSMWRTLLAGEVWQSEIVNRNRDGTLTTFEQTTTPVTDPAGGITHFVSIYRDIGQRKRMELAVAESEERFRTLALATVEAVLIHDDRCILEVNPAAVELFGYPQAEFIGRSILDLIDEPGRESARRHFQSDSVAPEEFQGVRKDGTRFLFEVQCRPCPFRGRVVRVAAIRDITEARRDQQRIQTLLQQKALELERSRIARDMHDEMGSSLTRITLLGEAAELGMDSADEKERAGARARVQRISALGRSLVVSMDEIVWAVKSGNDSLEECASYLCHFAPDLLKTAGIQCRLAVPEEFPVRIVGMEVRHNLLLVVKEALHNIVKHSGATSVTLTLEVMGDDLRITLADNGQGFDPGSARPLGNGLRNMRQRMLDAKGHLDLVSEPGKGTRITIRVGVSNLAP